MCCSARDASSLFLPSSAELKWEAQPSHLAKHGEHAGVCALLLVWLRACRSNFWRLSASVCVCSSGTHTHTHTHTHTWLSSSVALIFICVCIEQNRLARSNDEHVMIRGPQQSRQSKQASFKPDWKEASKLITA